MTDKQGPTFLPLTDVYEPSAIQQLQDGRFLVVEDEQSHALSLVTIDAQGAASAHALTPGLLQIFSDFWKLDDLEGLALDQSGFVYAITSHSRNESGKQKESRERLVRFRIDGKAVVDYVVVDGLKGAMTATHPVLAAAARIRDVKVEGGLNIEALEISPDQQRLLVGFRSPLQGGCAIIASVDNLLAMFTDGAEPHMVERLHLLDLDGGGIRALSYVPSLAGYLVIGGPISREPQPFKLWFWSGQPDAPARRVAVESLADLRRAEGVCPATINGVEKIIIVSDDGDRKLGRPAHYLLLDPGALHIAA